MALTKGQKVWISGRDHGFKYACEAEVTKIEGNEVTVYLAGWDCSCTLIDGRYKSSSNRIYHLLETIEQASAWEDGTLDLVEYEED